MKHPWIVGTGAALVLLTLGCTGGSTEAEPDKSAPEAAPEPAPEAAPKTAACSKAALKEGIEASDPGFPVLGVGRMACKDTHALAAVKYDCTACEPIGQYLLRQTGTSWTVVQHGSGMSPSDCSSLTSELPEADCKALFAEFDTPKKRKRRPAP